MDSIVVRKATIEDLESVLRILNYEILNGTATFDHNPKDLAELREYYLNRVSQNFPFIVAVQNNDIVGYATYGPFRFKEGYKFTVENSIYIDHNQQGKGIGKLLLNELVIIAKNAGIRSIMAGIEKDNTGSIAFHEKQGFNEVGRIPFAAQKFDRWLELVFLQLVLD